MRGILVSHSSIKVPLIILVLYFHYSFSLERRNDLTAIFERSNGLVIVVLLIKFDLVISMCHEGPLYSRAQVLHHLCVKLRLFASLSIVSLAAIPSLLWAIDPCGNLLVDSTVPGEVSRDRDPSNDRHRVVILLASYGLKS